MAKDPFAIIDDENSLPTIDMSSLKRSAAQTGRQDPVQKPVPPSAVADRSRPSAAEIARAAAIEGFTTRDGTGKVDGRTLRRSGRTALFSARTTPGCKDLAAMIVEARGKAFTTGQLLEEALELWVKQQNDEDLLKKLNELDIHGQAR